VSANKVKWYQKQVETQTKAFLYSIGSWAKSDSPDYFWIYDYLRPLFKEINSHLCGHYHDFENDFFEEGDEDPTWIEFNEQIRGRLCEDILSNVRSFIQDALPEVDFPEEGVLEQLKVKMPILFASCE
jgi:hypothetical protein